MGLTLHYQDKLDEAIQVFEKAISINPSFYETHKNLSHVLLRSGRLKEGLDKLEWRWKTKNFYLQKGIFHNLSGMENKV